MGEETWESIAVGVQRLSAEELEGACVADEVPR